MSYQVRSGDCLSVIAQRYHVSLGALVKANPQIHNPNLIFPGQKLAIPGQVDTFQPAPKKAAPKPATPKPAAPSKVTGALPHSSSAFINSVAAGAVASKHQYGVPASVTIAQAILESGWGKSGLAAQGHNLFGVKGTGPAGVYTCKTQEFWGGSYHTITANFRRYHNNSESMADHARLLATSHYYTHAMTHKNDPKAFAQALQGVYATSPVYAKTLISIMNQYNLYAYDKV
jgi:flagellum-specific peptidoglycan hydrolase FlgJ